MAETAIVEQYDGERLVARYLRDQKSTRFPSRAITQPVYDEALAKEALEVAKRFCSGTLTSADRVENLFACDQPTIQAGVRQFDSQRLKEMFYDTDRQAIGCAQANCVSTTASGSGTARPSSVLICRPSEASTKTVSGIDSLQNCRLPKPPTDARGCPLTEKTPWITKTPTLYRNSVFRKLVGDAVDTWVHQLNASLAYAARGYRSWEQMAQSEADAEMERLYRGAHEDSIIRKIAEAHIKERPAERPIQQITSSQKTQFVTEAQNTAYAMYFPNAPLGGDTVLTPNETWLLVRHTLQTVPLIRPQDASLLIHKRVPGLPQMWTTPLQ